MPDHAGLIYSCKWAIRSTRDTSRGAVRVVSDVSVLCPRRGVHPDNNPSSLWKIRADLYAGIQAELNHHPEIVTGGVVIDDLPIPQLVPLDVLDLEPLARWLDGHQHPPVDR